MHVSRWFLLVRACVRACGASVARPAASCPRRYHRTRRQATDSPPPHAQLPDRRHQDQDAVPPPTRPSLPLLRVPARRPPPLRDPPLDSRRHPARVRLARVRHGPRTDARAQRARQHGASGCGCSDRRFRSTREACQAARRTRCGSTGWTDIARASHRRSLSPCSNSSSRPSASASLSLSPPRRQLDVLSLLHSCPAAPASQACRVLVRARVREGQGTSVHCAVQAAALCCRGNERGEKVCGSSCEKRSANAKRGGGERPKSEGRKAGVEGTRGRRDDGGGAGVYAFLVAVGFLVVVVFFLVVVALATAFFVAARARPSSVPLVSPRPPRRARESPDALVAFLVVTTRGYVAGVMVGYVVHMLVLAGA